MQLVIISHPTYLTPPWVVVHDTDTLALAIKLMILVWNIIGKSISTN